MTVNIDGVIAELNTIKAANALLSNTDILSILKIDAMRKLEGQLNLLRQKNG